MKEFFENLKEIRKRKKLSLEEISQKSRLALKYLQAIEEGNLENLPAGYSRIFFKRYLKEIGEDTEEVWRDFNLFFGSGLREENLPYSSDIPEQSQHEEQTEPAEQALSEQKLSFFQKLSLRLNMDKVHRYFWISVTLIVLGVVGYFAYQQFLFVKDNPLQVKEITISDLIEEMQRQDSLLTPQMSQNTVIRSQNPGEVKVELTALERTWIREIRDKTDTTDYIMPPGLKRKIEAQESVQLLLGRADGVEVRLNNENLGVMGEADEIVLRLLLTQNGVVEKRLKKVSHTPRKQADTTASEAVTTSRQDTTALEQTGETL